eukprot:1182671-Prorocentrum_minimum.AAC.3
MRDHAASGELSWRAEVPAAAAAPGPGKSPRGGGLRSGPVGELGAHHGRHGGAAAGGGRRGAGALGGGGGAGADATRKADRGAHAGAGEQQANQQTN